MTTRTTPSWGDYDAIVTGGGIAGCAAAWELANRGQSVLLLEPTGSLGREITRGRVAVWTPQGAGFPASLSDHLHALGAVLGHALDPVAAAGALDATLEGARVTVIFHAWAATVEPTGAALRVTIATKDGDYVACGTTIIDASRFGRLAGSGSLGTDGENEWHRLNLLFAGVEGPIDQYELTLPLEAYGSVRLRAASGAKDGEVRLSVGVNRMLDDAELAPFVSALLHELPSPFEGATLALVADESCSGTLTLWTSTASQGRPAEWTEFRRDVDVFNDAALLGAAVELGGRVADSVAAPLFASS